MAGQRAIVAVLAGGRGERLGGCKATVLLGGKPLLRYPLDAADEAGLEAVVVAKRDSALPPLERHALVSEPRHPRHPLCGAVVALEHAASLADVRSVVLLPCDMPFIGPRLLASIALGRGAALTSLAGRPQPMPARLPVSAAGALRRSLYEGISLTDALLALAPGTIELNGESPRYGDPARLLFNVNDTHDLRAAEELLERSAR
jgi:molybdopterin-guanine dinucleotide biosynthesis protein A